MNVKDTAALLETLRQRFEKHMSRHPGLAWETVRDKIAAKPAALASLKAMEDSGGEPDLVAADGATGALAFYDCSPESPAGRRSLCYDRAALDARKENKPAGSAVEMAAAMGIELLSEEQYRELQRLGEFDRKTSSWVKTPDSIRAQGGATFCDRRYGHVFFYHNGADSYYGARGFRGRLTV